VPRATRSHSRCELPGIPGVPQPFARP
jgi:hypothetical protein